MDSTQQPVRHLSVCSGYEGLGLGLRRVFPGLREIAYIEIEAFAIANLVSKAEEGKLDSAPIYTDVKSFPFRQFRGKVDILSGGFPCQPFSVAGGRKGTDDERHVYPAISAGIRQCQPTVVFLENVPGIITTRITDGTPVLQHVLQDLEGMGYTATAGIFSAEEVGAPHRRDRVFILAYAESERHRGGRDEERGVDGWFVQPHEQGRSEVGSETKGRGGELGDTDIQRLEGVEFGINHPQRWQEPDGSTGLPSRTASAWPARPGHEQYEWEEPRTTQPQLGGATDGDTSGVDAVKFRVDRLRMIGNGVVPETAERAYQVLAERLRGES
jgi:DNA (cytosine-5)-methyltransferase 1